MGRRVPRMVKPLFTKAVNTRQGPRLSSKNMPLSVGGRVIGRAGELYENSEVVSVDYLAPLVKSLSRPLPLKN